MVTLEELQRSGDFEWESVQNYLFSTRNSSLFWKKVLQSYRTKINFFDQCEKPETFTWTHNSTMKYSYAPSCYRDAFLQQLIFADKKSISDAIHKSGLYLMAKTKFKAKINPIYSLSLTMLGNIEIRMELYGLHSERVADKSLCSPLWTEVSGGSIFLWGYFSSARTAK